MAVPILIARGADFARRVAAEVERQVALLPRRAIAEQSLRDQGAIFVVDSDDEMADAINRLAPEHAELAVRDARALAARITTAGALFLGAHTPEPVGDYIAGPSHVLPTGGSARFSGPLSVADFVKRTSIIEYDAAALEAQTDHITALTAVEGLDAHGRAVTIRTRPLDRFRSVRAIRTRTRPGAPGNRIASFVRPSGDRRAPDLSRPPARPGLVPRGSIGRRTKASSLRLLDEIPADDGAGRHADDHKRPGPRPWTVRGWRSRSNWRAGFGSSLSKANPAASVPR